MVNADVRHREAIGNLTAAVRDGRPAACIGCTMAPDSTIRSEPRDPVAGIKRRDLGYGQPDERRRRWISASRSLSRFEVSCKSA